MLIRLTEQHQQALDEMQGSPPREGALMEPGEIYLADFPEAGPHPVFVVSREELNRGHYALVVVCTSARFAVRSQLASCVPFHAGQFGFAADCVAQCENILSIDERQLARAGAGRIGVLDEIEQTKQVGRYDDQNTR